MPLPPSLARLALPAIAAPMFLGSGPELVITTCKAGVVGTFPALNCRTGEALDAWIETIAARLDPAAGDAPFGVNLVVRRSNERFEADLARIVRHRVPLVITSLGADRGVVEAVHDYGGLVFHDVVCARHAERAAAAGVDGIIAIAAGAGGHGGTLSPFALLAEVRRLYAGTIVLGGALSTGADIAAARVMGADLAYLGTRFLATAESMAPDGYKQMMLAARTADILHTPNVSGVPANFLVPSLRAAGLDPLALPSHEVLRGKPGTRAWVDLWSAGQGVAAIDDLPPVAELCARLIRDYRHAMYCAAQDSFAR